MDNQKSDLNGLRGEIVPLQMAVLLGIWVVVTGFIALHQLIG
ncbi:MAG: hypothetical protein ACFHX7_17795 [Pseudomonadota bacterium]